MKSMDTICAHNNPSPQHDRRSMQPMHHISRAAYVCLRRREAKPCDGDDINACTPATCSAPDPFFVPLLPLYRPLALATVTVVRCTIQCSGSSCLSHSALSTRLHQPGMPADRCRDWNSKSTGYLKLRISMARVSLPLVALLAFCTLVVHCGANLETPEYTVLHEDDDFELRLYNETVWAVAEVEDVSFARATGVGFHRLFSYIAGGNLNWSKIDMTAPVLTGIVPSAGPFCSSAFAVRLYLPACFQKDPPTPLPDLQLTFERWSKQTIAVRKFSGYAQDSNVAQEAEKLAISLDNSDYAKNATYPVNGEDSYAIAQYSSPFQFWSRVNEVWVNIQLPGFDPSTKEKVTLQMVTDRY